MSGTMMTIGLDLDSMHKLDYTVVIRHANLVMFPYRIRQPTQSPKCLYSARLALKSPLTINLFAI
jgi:hypothetical protein